MVKKKTGEDNTSGAGAPVVFNASRSWLGTAKRTKLVVGGTLVAVVLLGLGLYVWSQNRPFPITLKAGDAISGQIVLLPNAQLKRVAHARVSARWHPSQAYAKALALSQLNDQQASIKEYQTLVATGKAQYYVYVDYSLTQANSGHFSEAATIMQQAIIKLKADSNQDARSKSDEIKLLSEKADVFRDEANS